MSRARTALSALALALGAAGASAAPACSRGTGAVDRLLCRDAGLAALDQGLQQAYRQALAQARGPARRALVVEQGGWARGRADCWKADGQPTWITASWTEDTVLGCARAQTRLRTAELQALWRLKPPTTVAHACQGQAVNELVVSAFDTDPPVLRIERGDRVATLWQVGPAEVGAERFEGANVSLRRQGGGWQVEWLDTASGRTESLDCRPR
jgi:uncharacterized protein YecT (DUF1311 family)